MTAAINPRVRGENVQGDVKGVIDKSAAGFNISGIDFELKYPLSIRRQEDGVISVVDMDFIVVAEASTYTYAVEIVRLANSAYKLLSDLTRKRPVEYTGGQPRNLGLGEKETT